VKGGSSQPATAELAWVERLLDCAAQHVRHRLTELPKGIVFMFGPDNNPRRYRVHLVWCDTGDEWGRAYTPHLRVTEENTAALVVESLPGSWTRAVPGEWPMARPWETA
jgi:hypothetical protein